ncbi:SDR family oxidoreductase, partial [Halomonas sp. ATBC28]|uniref:SDR family oxidoreductase n=1 Tax=Halomonas sp. ATBC28 TaxID=2545264 RepID=UPI00110E9875
SLSLLVLVLGFGEGDLIHGSTESYAVDDSRIITDGSDFFRASLVKHSDINRIASSLSEVKFNLIIHNASALGEIGSVELITESSWNDTFMLNLFAPFFLTKKLLNNVNDGRVLFISSSAGVDPIPNLIAYSITKSAIMSLKESLNIGSSEYNICYGCLDPGMINTSMQSKLRNASSDVFPQSKKFQQIYKIGLLKSPDDIAISIIDAVSNMSDKEFTSGMIEVKYGS